MEIHLAVRTGTCAGCDHKVRDEPMLVVTDRFGEALIEPRHLDDPGFDVLRSGIGEAGLSDLAADRRES